MSNTLDLCRAVLASSLTEERRPEGMRVHRQALAEATRLATARERERILLLLDEYLLNHGGEEVERIRALICASHAVEET
jgi:hypothetical protein